MAKPVVRKPKKKQNPLKAAKIEDVDYKDTALLRKFISDRGKIRARRVTGVSVQEQRQIAKAVKNAREMALLPYSQLRSLIGGPDDEAHSDPRGLRPRRRRATSSRSRTATPATT